MQSKTLKVSLPENKYFDLQGILNCFQIASFSLCPIAPTTEAHQRNSAVLSSGCHTDGLRDVYEDHRNIRLKSPDTLETSRNKPNELLNCK